MHRLKRAMRDSRRKRQGNSPHSPEPVQHYDPPVVPAGAVCAAAAAFMLNPVAAMGSIAGTAEMNGTALFADAAVMAPSEGVAALELDQTEGTGLVFPGYQAAQMWPSEATQEAVHVHMLGGAGQRWDSVTYEANNPLLHWEGPMKNAAACLMPVPPKSDELPLIPPRLVAEQRMQDAGYEHGSIDGIANGKRVKEVPSYVNLPAATGRSVDFSAETLEHAPLLSRVMIAMGQPVNVARRASKDDSSLEMLGLQPTRRDLRKTFGMKSWQSLQRSLPIAQFSIDEGLYRRVVYGHTQEPHDDVVKPRFSLSRVPQAYNVTFWSSPEQRAKIFDHIAQSVALISPGHANMVASCVENMGPMFGTMKRAGSVVVRTMMMDGMNNLTLIEFRNLIPESFQAVEMMGKAEVMSNMIMAGQGAQKNPFVQMMKQQQAAARQFNQSFLSGDFTQSSACWIAIPWATPMLLQSMNNTGMSSFDDLARTSMIFHPLSYPYFNQRRSDMHASEIVRKTRDVAYGHTHR